MDVDLDRPVLPESFEDETMEYEDDHSQLIISDKVEEAVMEDPPPPASGHTADGDEVMDEGFGIIQSGAIGGDAGGEGMEAEPTPPLKVEKTLEFPLPVPSVADVAPPTHDAAPVVNGSNGGNVALATETTGAGPSQPGPRQFASKEPAELPTAAAVGESEAHEDGDHAEQADEEHYDEEGIEAVHAEGENHEEATDEDEIPRIDSSSLPSIILHLPSLGTRSLFGPISSPDEAGPSQPIKVYLEGRESILAEASLLDVWTEIRSEIVREGGNAVGEMVLEEKQMELQMGEDDINIQATTLLEFLQVYLDCELPTPVEMHVKFQPSRFAARYAAIQQELAAQAKPPVNGHDAEGEVGGEAVEGEEYEEYEDEVHEGELVEGGEAEDDEHENEGNEAPSMTQVEAVDHEDAPPAVSTSERKDLVAGGETGSSSEVLSTGIPAHRAPPKDDAELYAEHLEDEAATRQLQETEIPETSKTSPTPPPEASALAAGSTTAPIQDEPAAAPGDAPADLHLAKEGASAADAVEANFETVQGGDGGAGDEGDAAGDVAEGEEEYDEEYYEDEVQVEADPTAEDGADGAEGPVEVEVAGEIVEDDLAEEVQDADGNDEEQDVEGEANDFDVEKFVEHIEEQDGNLETAVEGSADAAAPDDDGVEAGAEEDGDADEEGTEISPQQAQQLAKEEFEAANQAAAAAEEADQAVDAVSAVLNDVEAREAALDEREAELEHREEELHDEIEEAGENDDFEGDEAGGEETVADADDTAEYANGDDEVNEAEEADADHLNLEEPDENEGEEGDYEAEEELLEDPAAESGDTADAGIPEPTGSKSKRRYAAPDIDEEEDEFGDEPESKKSKVDEE